MITFFPGPSRVYPQIANFMQEAFDKGLLSISHRSETFNAMSEKTIGLLKKKLNIPENYTIYYTSSATESWEIIPQSLTQNQSVHFFSGAFGEKWFDYTQKLRPNSVGNAFDINEDHNIDEWNIPTSAEIIGITQNETSNGTQIRPALIKQLREKYPEKLIAVDVTSSLAGISLPFEAGDIWYGSVQKCFGMPAGLGLLICSPRVVARAKEIADRNHYNSLLILDDNIQKWQTSCTPNVLAIYLLMRVLETIPSIDETDKMIKARAKAYYEAVAQSKTLMTLIENVAVRSDTIIAIRGTKEQVLEWKASAKKENILLGAGYGKWKETSFRIANFPALQENEVQAMLAWLAKQ